MKCICEVCSKEFNRSPSDVKRGGGKFCSHECRAVAKGNEEGITSLGGNEVSNGADNEVSVFQEKVDKIVKERGKLDYVLFGRLGMKKGVRKYQVTLQGRVVCFPTCVGVGVGKLVCSVCGCDNTKYFEPAVFNKCRNKKYNDILVPRGFVEEHGKLCDVLRNCMPVEGRIIRDGEGVGIERPKVKKEGK